MEGSEEKQMITHRGEKFSGYGKVKRTPGGKKKIVRFGDPQMSIKKDQPARKASYCARSGGITGKDNIFSPNYWSRKQWSC